MKEINYYAQNSSIKQKQTKHFKHHNDPFVIIEVPSEAKSLYESLFAEFRSWCNNPLNTF